MFRKKLLDIPRKFEYANIASRTKINKVKKYAFISGIMICPAAYYVMLDDGERRSINVTFSGIKRFYRSTKVGISICADYWWNTRNLDDSSDESQPIYEKIHERCAKRILECCLKNEGLYIKLGQSLVNLDHILPKEYAQTLKVLQDKCLTRKDYEIEQIFKEDFGKPINEMFSSFESVPIAAASIAQVFKATTKEGIEVAVKAQYIDLRDRFNGDIRTLNILLTIVSFVFPLYDFRDVLKELKSALELELDFINEANNAEKCTKDLCHLNYLYVPKVFRDKTSNRILTTEFIEGIKVNETEKLLNEGFSLADIDYKLFTIFAEQIFNSGNVHADPHPGNILIRKKSKNSAEIVLLDHGLYETLPDSYRISLSNLWKCIVMGEHDGMKKYTKELGIENNYRLFCMALTQRYISPEKGDENDLMKWIFQLRGKTLNRVLHNETNEEQIRIKAELNKVHDQMLEIFKNLPSYLMLVSRNLNAVRSIGKIHGNPVDRHKIMAHCATRRLFYEVSNKSFIDRYKCYWLRFIFELQLWYDSMKRFIFGLLWANESQR